MVVTTLYDVVGGEPVFRQLVAEFYRGVAEDPVLRPLYPEDLGPAEEASDTFVFFFAASCFAISSSRSMAAMSSSWSSSVSP